MWNWTWNKAFRILEFNSNMFIQVATLWSMQSIKMDQCWNMFKCLETSHTVSSSFSCGLPFDRARFYLLLSTSLLLLPQKVKYLSCPLRYRLYPWADKTPESKILTQNLFLNIPPPRRQRYENEAGFFLWTLAHRGWRSLAGEKAFETFGFLS